MDDAGMPIVEQVIRELNSGYTRSGACGPLKEVNGVSLVGAVADAAARDIVATVSVEAYQESPYGHSADTECRFELSCRDIAVLAETAPSFRPHFAQMFAQVSSRLEEARAQKKLVDDWCDAGLPTQEATRTLKPLRFVKKPKY